MAAEKQKTAGEAAREKVENRDAEAGTVEPSGLTETSGDAGKSTEELRRDVEDAREELADTVTELGQKVDPRPKVEAAQAQAKSAAKSYGPPAAGVALLLLALLIWLKRR
jgi:hypothetical protein